MSDTRIGEDVSVRLAEAIGCHMGEGWSGERSTSGAAQLAGPDGARLYLRVGGGHSRIKPGRVEITGSYPRHQMYGITCESITVAIDRGAAVIAREINRRILRSYLPQLAKVQADIIEAERNSRARAELAAQLAAVVGGSVAGVADRDTQARVSFFRPLDVGGAVSGDVRIAYAADRGDVELRGVSVETLRAVMQLVAESLTPGDPR